MAQTYYDTHYYPPFGAKGSTDEARDCCMFNLCLKVKHKKKWQRAEFLYALTCPVGPDLLPEPGPFNKRVFYFIFISALLGPTNLV